MLVKKPVSLVPKILFWNKWRKITQEETSQLKVIFQTAIKLEAVAVINGTWKSLQNSI